MTSTLALTSPLDYQVIQRRSLHEGIIPVTGSCNPPCERVEVRLSGKSMDGVKHASHWLTAEPDPATGGFRLDLVAPAGGWYAVHARALMGSTTVARRLPEQQGVAISESPAHGRTMKSASLKTLADHGHGGSESATPWAPNGLSPIFQTVAKGKVAHVGVGEVFVGAGQSNSTNCGGIGSTHRRDGRTKTLTRRVSTFDGSQWRIADDPQPGAHDVHNRGSFWPAFGDAMATRFGVPIGVAVTGHAGTSIRQWTRRDPLFHWTLNRLRQLGPDGFRALLWHQGENDADTGMSTNEYSEGLAEIICDMRSELGREFPFFVALATFIPWPKDSFSPEIRAAQQLLWQRGIALEGPDTDAMLGDLRDCGGKGIHFSKEGLKVHGEAWAEKVAHWLDGIMHSESLKS